MMIKLLARPAFSRIFTALFCLSCVLPGPLTAKEILLPDMGASSSVSLSAEMEQKIARSIISQLQSGQTIIEDVELNEYLTNLGYSLVEQTDDALQPFHFYLLNSRQINAFATPGGVVAVYSGLFLNTETESELASVLAHEIAHVTQHHIARAFEKANEMSIPLTLGLVAAILLGAAGSVDAGMAAATGIQALGVQNQINFTRAHEKEADRIGMNFLHKAHFDPYGMVDFFHRLHQKNRYVGKNYPDFLKTHPVTLDRISEAKTSASQLKHSMMTVNPELDYQLMKRKLAVLVSKDLHQLLQYYKKSTESQSRNKNPVDDYTYAYALLKSNQSDLAIPIFKQLEQQHPENIFFIRAAAEALLSSSHAQDHRLAMQKLKQALNAHPLDSALSVMYSDALIQNNLIDDSIAFIKKLNQNLPDKAIFYKQLSRAYSKKDDALQMHMNMAQYYHLNGQYEQAIIQTKLAKKYALNDFYSLSRLEAKLIELKEEKQKFSLDEEISEKK